MLIDLDATWPELTLPDDISTIACFDLETQKGAGEVGGWENASKMLMSIGVVYYYPDKRLQLYSAHQASDLVRDLMEVDCVVGWNHVKFDYEVLRDHGGDELRTCVRNFDLMIDMQKQLGFRPHLEGVSQATLNAGKHGDGLMALHWWKTGQHEKLIRYCAYDVKNTFDILAIGVNTGIVQIEKSKKTKDVSVPNWKRFEYWSDDSPNQMSLF